MYLWVLFSVSFELWMGVCWKWEWECCGWVLLMWIGFCFVGGVCVHVTCLYGTIWVYMYICVTAPKIGFHKCPNMLTGAYNLINISFYTSSLCYIGHECGCMCIIYIQFRCCWCCCSILVQFFSFLVWFGLAWLGSAIYQNCFIYKVISSV